MKMTIFNNIYDTNTSNCLELKSWDHLCSVLEKLSKKPGFKPAKGERLNGRKPSQLISPAYYKEGTTRANANVVAWAGWAALDMDSYIFENPENFQQELIDKYGKYEFVCYSTSSSRKEHPKFRMVFPLTEYLQNENIKDFWYAINTEFNSMVDKQTKDLSRLFYIPAVYPGSFNFFFRNHGSIINAQEFIEKYPNPEKDSDDSLFGSLNGKIRDQITALNFSKCNNVDLTWNSYKDCPLVNKKLVTEYSLILGSGWYSHMYTIMCSIAANAKLRGYPITASEIAQLCKEIDRDHGNWYKDRPFSVEAKRAIEYTFGR